jgi:acetolactate synthase I/II/III large subunit
MTCRAADLLVDCLATHGVDRVFCVPGESYLAVLDALHDRNAVQTVICRHEAGAGFMAIADAKLTHKPGIAFVSRGPGAANASIAVHVAEQDAVPMILFIGQVPRNEAGRGAFQEVDYAKMFGDMAKMVATIENADRIPEVLARAFVVASTPTPGPVVIVLPEDMLEDRTGAPVIQPMSVPRASGGAAADVERVAAMIARAERPLMIVGGGLSPMPGRAAMVAASDAHGLPVAPTFKRQEIFPNAHSHYAGHLGFKIPRGQIAMYEDADLIVAVGTRLGELSTQGYTFPASPVPKQPLIHITDDARHIGRNFATTLGIVADPTAFLNALAAKPSTPSSARKAWAAKLHEYVAGKRAWTPPKDGKLDMGAVVGNFGDAIADDAIFITDAGNFSGWLHKHVAFNGRQEMIGAVGGAMGGAMPAAVAAGLRFPKRQVITWIGDGGALMTGAELATAIRYGVPVKVFIANNGSYGTIRQHQERAYKTRVHGTQLTNPDFAKWGESFGARGFTIKTIAEAAKIVAEALSHNGPVVVDVRTTVDHITPGMTIADMHKRTG